MKDNGPGFDTKMSSSEEASDEGICIQPALLYVTLGLFCRRSAHFSEEPKLGGGAGETGSREVSQEKNRGVVERRTARPVNTALIQL